MLLWQLVVLGMVHVQRFCRIGDSIRSCTGISWRNPGSGVVSGFQVVKDGVTGIEQGRFEVGGRFHSVFEATTQAKVANRVEKKNESIGKMRPGGKRERGERRKEREDKAQRWEGRRSRADEGEMLCRYSRTAYNRSAPNTAVQNRNARAREGS